MEILEDIWKLLERLGLVSGANLLLASGKATGMIPQVSGQIIIFHQPRFPWNSRGFPLLFTTIWGENSCEVAIIWPEVCPLPLHRHSQSLPVRHLGRPGQFLQVSSPHATTNKTSHGPWLVIPQRVGWIISCEACYKKVWKSHVEL